MRRLPSTLSTSFEKARSLSFARALATLRTKALRCLPPTAVAQRAAIESASSCWYQDSRLPIPASRRIVWRYSREAAATIRRRSRPANPRSRPASEKLAASRFRSHSQGPGSVSSKSLRSNTSRRSGEAKAPKFERWASPQSWVSKPVVAVAARSAAISAAAPR
jgi:hypothetical protein